MRRCETSLKLVVVLACQNLKLRELTPRFRILFGISVLQMRDPALDWLRLGFSPAVPVVPPNMLVDVGSFAQGSSFSSGE